MLQSHYSSTLDFSNDALKAAAKGYKKIINGLVLAKGLVYESNDAVDIDQQAASQIDGIVENCYRALNDDFNTAKAIAQIFNLLKKINSISTKNLQSAQLGKEAFNKLIDTYITLVEDVLGLQEEKPTNVDGIIDILLNIYRQAKEARDYDKVDEIRASLKQYGIVLKDMKDSIGWAYEE
jgi:cysteinyl-tRNA synthetase